MNKNKLMSAAALLASVVSTNVLAAEKEMTLMLDWFVNPNHGPIVIAKERGYFKEQGLKVNIQEPADPSTPPKLVAAGKVDMAISYQPSLTIDVAAGLPLIRSATLIATPLNTLMVLDNGKNENLGDLKGKKIGIAIAGNEEATIGTMLAQESVKFSDVQIINVGWALSSSLASGKVDAIWEQATTYIVNHPKESWREFVAYSPDTLNNELNQRAWNDTLTRFALRPSAVDLKRYDDYAEFMYSQKIIETLPKAKDYVPSFD
ncbi:ABC transporter substrate-binding protein [Vibrio harveyi]|uniref:ABC transporter substrate-binding protein n=1 Tax=Vibrio harveyi TaxID=669 RepID=UPI002F4272E8